MTISSSSKAVLAGISGTILQWYDFALFGYFAPIIASTYFPGNNLFVSLLSAFGIFRRGLFIGSLRLNIIWIYRGSSWSKTSFA
jgi:MHS family proline/betaine transporter-like MFS transporter